MAEADLAEFADVMSIQDEYAYRDMVTAGKIVLLDAGTSVKFLRSGQYGCLVCAAAGRATRGRSRVCAPRHLAGYPTR